MVVQTSRNFHHHEKEGLLGVDTIAALDILLVSVSSVELQPLISIICILLASQPPETEVFVELTELGCVEACQLMRLRIRQVVDAKIFGRSHLLWLHILCCRDVEEHAVDGSEPHHQLQAAEKVEMMQLDNYGNRAHVSARVFFCDKLNGDCQG